MQRSFYSAGTLFAVGLFLVAGFLTGIFLMHKENKSDRMPMVVVEPRFTAESPDRTVLTLLQSDAWSIVSYHPGTPEEIHSTTDKNWMITFAKDMTISGNVCNRFNGTYTLLGHTITSQTASTKMACGEGNTMEVEQMLLGGLGRGLIVESGLHGAIVLKDEKTGAKIGLMRAGQ